MGQVVWTPKMVTALQEMRDGGAAYSEIALALSSRFGVSLSLAVCSNKAKRLAKENANE